MCLKVNLLCPLTLSPSQICLLFVPHLRDERHPCPAQLPRAIAWLLTPSYNLLKSITNKFLLIVPPASLKSAHFFLSIFLLPHFVPIFIFWLYRCGSLIFFLFCCWGANVPISGQWILMGLCNHSNPVSSFLCLPCSWDSHLVCPDQWAIKRSLLGKLCFLQLSVSVFLGRENRFEMGKKEGEDAALSQFHWGRPSELQKYCWVFFSFWFSHLPWTYLSCEKNKAVSWSCC